MCHNAPGFSLPSWIRCFVTSSASPSSIVFRTSERESTSKCYDYMASDVWHTEEEGAFLATKSSHVASATAASSSALWSPSSFVVTKFSKLTASHKAQQWIQTELTPWFNTRGRRVTYHPFYSFLQGDTLFLAKLCCFHSWEPMRCYCTFKYML